MLALSPSVWDQVNRFVFLIAADDQNELSLQFKKLAVYPTLNRACVQWRQHTFFTLYQLAEQLSNGAVRTHLTEMKRAIDHRKTNPKEAEYDFGMAYNSLRDELDQLASLSKRATADLGDLDKSAEGALLQFEQRGNNVSQPLGVNKIQLADVKAALSSVNGQWGAITFDLNSLHAMVKTKLATDDPDLRELYIDFGLETWKNLEASAKHYLADFPRQQRNLSGDYYFDLVQVVPNVGLVLQNRAQDPPEHMPVWIFTRTPVSRGWWQIRSPNGEVLDVINNGESKADRENPALLHIPIMVNPFTEQFRARVSSDLPDTRGRLWRIVPAEAGCYRLYNALLGEWRSLECRRNVQGVPKPTGESTNTSLRNPLDTCVMALTDLKNPAQEWNIVDPTKQNIR